MSGGEGTEFTETGPSERGRARPKVKLQQFHHLETARAAAAKEHFDLFVIEARFFGGEGGEWAARLQGEGQRVVILDTFPVEGLPFVSKGDFGQGEALLRILRSL